MLSGGPEIAIYFCCPLHTGRDSAKIAIEFLLCFYVDYYIAIIILATAKFGEIQQESELIKLQTDAPLKLTINNRLGAY